MKKIQILGTLIALIAFIPVSNARAVIVTLNGQLDVTQSFANDTNVTISSANGTHSLGWSGQLSAARGGTGATSFTSNGILFGNGSGALQATSAPSSAQLLIGNGSGVPTFVSMSGDATISNSGVISIGDDKVVEADLKAVDSASDEECLTYESTSGDFEWQNCGGGGGGMSIGTAVASSTQGSILFSDGTNLAQDNANLFWDDSSNRLGIGITTPEAKLDVNGMLYAADLVLNPRPSITEYSKGVIEVGAPEATGNGIDLEFYATDALSEGSGGQISMYTGSAAGQNGNGGDLYLVLGRGYGEGRMGRVSIQSPSSPNYSEINLSLDQVEGAKTIYFPNSGGTMSVLEADQTFTGQVQFSAVDNNPTTVKIGAHGIPGCLVLGDSDYDSVTYITVDDGVISASTSKPNTCN